VLSLSFAAIAFLLLHRAVSAGSLRAPLVALVGETAFRITFSLASIACLAWLWLAFDDARHSVAGRPLFVTPPMVEMAQLPLQLVAVVLVVAGLTTRNPTTSGMAASALDRDIVQGFVRITRHPFLWGVTIFAVGHMAASPNLASWAFFGTLGVLAVTGTYSIDAKRRRSLGGDWTWFASSTSNLPFLAIIQGRQQFRLGELGWWRLMIAFVFYLVLMWIHPELSGRSPLVRMLTGG
jgi:uncharacterized membrane protein